MAEIIRFKSGNMKIKSKRADFIQETLDKLNEMKVKKEESGKKIAGAMPFLLFNRKIDIRRQ